MRSRHGTPLCALAIPSLAILVACASRPEPPAPTETRFASLALAQATPAAEREPAPTEVAAPEPPPPRAEPPLHTGLLDVSRERLDSLRAVAGDPEALLANPIAEADFEALAVLRSPEVAAARDRLDAARTEVQQSADLSELVALSRAWTRSMDARIGPMGPRRPTELWPDLDALSGELVRRTVAIAREQARAAVRDAVAEARRVAADAGRIDAARAILDEELALQGALVSVARTRYESGRTSQAALLAFEGRLRKLTTDRANLDEDERLVRARANRLLDRPEDAPLAIAPRTPEPRTLEAAPLVTRALESRQEVRVAALAQERAAIAVRLAERMTLPAPEAVYPEPGRMSPLHADLGVRESQLEELRARSSAAARMSSAVIDGTRTAVRAAVTAHEMARRRVHLGEVDLVPLARQALEASRAAYEADRAGWIELLDAERTLLKARLGLVDARRDLAHAGADLLQAVGVRTESEDQGR